MTDKKISELNDGSTAVATDRIPVARSPFGATDNDYITPGYIDAYVATLAHTWTDKQTFTPPDDTEAISITMPSGTTAMAIVFPTGDADNADFGIRGVSEASNVGSSRKNSTWGFGYNIDSSGARIMGGEASFGFNLEAHYEPVTGDDFAEFYVGLGNNDDTLTTRNIFLQWDKITGNTEQFRFSSGPSTNGIWFMAQYDDLTSYIRIKPYGVPVIAFTANSATWTINHQREFVFSDPYDNALTFELGSVLALTLNKLGRIGIMNQNPTAWLDTPASTTAAASVRIRSGTAPTSPNSGDLWYDGTNLKFRDGSTTRTITWT